MLFFVVETSILAVPSTFPLESYIYTLVVFAPIIETIVLPISNNLLLPSTLYFAAPGIFVEIIVICLKALKIGDTMTLADIVCALLSFDATIKLSVTDDNLLVIQEYQIKYSTFYTPKYNLRFETTNTDKVTYIDLSKCNTQDLVFPIGMTLTPDGEQLVYINLEDEPNILVTGTNGSGKSSFIKCLLTSMVLRNIEIKVFDLKFSGDYNVFRNYKHLTTFITDLGIARNELNKIKQTMDERYNKLNQTNCKNYSVYNNKFKNDQMKPIVCIIEEYYMLNTKQYKATDILNPILSKCRACNIKFIIVLQRPCSENLEPVLKANLNHIVAFRVVSKPNSTVVLGDGDYRLFTDLHDKGEAIIHDMYQDIQFKSFFLEDDDDSNQTSLIKYGVLFDITIEMIIAHKCKKPSEQSIEEIPENKPIETKTIPIKSLKNKKVSLVAK